MTITTYGYAGEVDEIAYAAGNVAAGVRYGVAGFADFRATAGGAGDRAVTIAAGEATGGGVRAVNSDPVVLNHATVGAGSRWDMIVLRRDWGTGTAVLAIITGSATKALPARDADIGDVDDQPIALVRVAAGSSIVAEVIDLRVIAGDGGLFARDELVLQYLDRVGTMIRIGDRLWFLTVNGSGSSTWVRHDAQADTGWVECTRNFGWSFNFCQVRRIGGIIFYRISGTRGVGWNPGNQLAIIPAGFRPDVTHWAGNHDASGNFVHFQVEPDGNVLAAVPSNGATGTTLVGSYPAPITA